VKKITKKHRKAEIADGAVADDSCSEEEGGLDIDAAVVPPMKESWEPVEFKIFVRYGPPIGEACRLELDFLASARGNVDAVKLPSDGEGVATDRPAKSRLEARKKKLQFDKKHKNLKKDHGTRDGEIYLVSPNLTPASKAVRGELRVIRREMFSINNYQNSLTLAFNMAAQNHARQQAIVADVEEYRLHMKEQLLAQLARQACAPAPRAADIGDPSTSGHEESAINDKASEAATVDYVISSTDNESEEERGGNGEVED
jgi:hypothetical protein